MTGKIDVAKVLRAAKGELQYYHANAALADECHAAIPVAAAMQAVCDAVIDDGLYDGYSGHKHPVRLALAKLRAARGGT